MKHNNCAKVLTRTIQVFSPLAVEGFRCPSHSCCYNTRNESLVGVYHLGNGLSKGNDGVGVNVGHESKGGVPIDSRMLKIDSGTTIGSNNDLSKRKSNETGK